MEWILIIVIIISIALLILGWRFINIHNEKIKQNLINEAEVYVKQILKSKSLEPIPPKIILKNDEFAFLQTECSLKETRSIRYYQSGHTGIRIAKRFYFGSSSGTSHSEEVFRNIDFGTLTLTNKRLVFSGSSTSRNIQISKIISVTSFIYEIEIASESRQKNMVFNVSNPFIWEFTIKLLLFVHNPFALTKEEIREIDPENKLLSDEEYDSDIVNTQFKTIAEMNNSTFEQHIVSNQILNEQQFSSPSKYQFMNIDYCSKLHPDYTRKRNMLLYSFENAYNFLKMVENNNNNIWLSTASNAHLYKGNKFLAYIILGDDLLSFRARFNHKIHVGTIDESRKMFSIEFHNLILSLNGYTKGWARQDGEFYAFTKTTPNQFFSSLFEYIINLNTE